MMAAAIVVPAASPALADSEESTKLQLQPAAALIIKAPEVAQVSQPLTISVYDKRGHETIAGASVYALKASELAVTADSENYTTLISGFTATAESKGVLIGTTGTDGTVTGTLSTTGRFILVATKDGFMAGFTRISITQAIKKGLNIKAPGSVEVNKPAVISVTERFTQKPVTGVAVYARLLGDNFTLHVSANPVAPQVHTIAQVQERKLDPLRKGTGPMGTAKAINLESAGSFRGQVEKPKPLLTAENVTVIRADPWDETVADSYAAEIQSGGLLLGTTDANGQVTYTFTDGGTYVLAGIEEAYIPGFARINVREARPTGALAINASADAAAQTVTLKVLEKSSGQAISGTAVYVLEINDIKSGLSAGGNDKRLNEADVVKAKGTLAGNSDDTGQLVYNFASAGRYAFAVFKDGFSPALTYVNCTVPVSQNSLVIKAPGQATAGDSATIVTVDADGKAVAKTAIYLVKIDALPDMAAALQASPSADKAFKQKYGAILREKSSFVGYTDDNGNITVKFSSSGVFMLLAVKDNYLPDFVKISIAARVTASPATSNKAQ
jgi:hypothetical protein